MAQCSSLPSASQGLGGGFRRVYVSERVSGGFESIYHGEYLYFRGRRLADYVAASVSPSRAFAAYAESDEAKLRKGEDGFDVFIFRAADQQTTRVTTKPISYQGEFRWEWHEAEHYVLLHFKDGRPPARFSLPRPKA